jgi:hypothetical protein
VKKIIDAMKAKIITFVKEVQSQMDQFSVALKAYALQELDRVNNMGDELDGGEVDQLSNEMIALMDSDILNQHLEGSKENVEGKIGDQESVITRALQRDWRDTETRITEDQHQRNRTIIKEIISTCDKFRKEISKLLSQNHNISFY